MIIAGGTVGYIYFPVLVKIIDFTSDTWIDNPYGASYIGLALGAIIFYLLSFWLVDYIVKFIQYLERTLLGAPLTNLFFGGIGLIIGLTIAFFINQPIIDFQIMFVSQIIPIFIMGLLGYLGFQVGFKRRDEFLNILTLVKKDKDPKVVTEDKYNEIILPKSKILDTSVIIDGRIADICQTHFLEGSIIIPHFVLNELQHIADSSDALKRNRGRRGLDILNRLQKETPEKIEMYEGNFDDIQEVDSKLVRLAKETDGIVVTNDFNLNKVCEFQNVPVLNINDLANAVKPVVLPGEQLSVQVIKDGKELDQGVAYLDDGTMIVVEEGRNYIGDTIEVLITSVLQTSAGRMIFAKPKALEKAQ